MITNSTSFQQTLTLFFPVGRALPVVDLKVSEGERAPSQGAPSGRDSIKQIFKEGQRHPFFGIFEIFTLFATKDVHEKENSK